MNIWQPQWTDDKATILQASDAKFLRMKYFILDLGRYYRKFNADTSNWDYTDSSLIYEGFEYRFRFTFNRGLINKYVQKGFKCAYATAVKSNEVMTTVLSFTQRQGRSSLGVGGYPYSENCVDPSIAKRIIIESSDTDLLIRIKPSYFIWQTDGTGNKQVFLRQVEVEATLPSIILWYPDFPEIKSINDIFSKKADESIVTFSIFDTGKNYRNQKGYFTLPVYDVASTGNGWKELEITVGGNPWNPILYINENESNDYINWCWRYVGDPRTWLNHIKQLPVPLPVDSRSHHNHTWTANGIKYISSQPSSEVVVETKKKSSPWIISLFNKLIKKDKKYE